MHFSCYRSNGEVVSLRPKSEIEPIAKPKLDSEQLPLRPKSVEVDSLVVKSSRESGKKRTNSFFLFGLQYLTGLESGHQFIQNTTECNYAC